MELLHFPDDVLVEICSHLLPISLLQFFSSCTKLWNLRQKADPDETIWNYQFCVETSNWEEGAYYAIGYRDLEGLEFFLKKGSSDEKYLTKTRKWLGHLRNAAWSGRQDIIDMLIQYGANDWDNGLDGAAENGNKQLIEFFIQKGATNWNVGLRAAASGGYLNLVQYFIDKGSSNLTFGLAAAAGNRHIEVVKFLCNKIQTSGLTLTHCHYDDIESALSEAVCENQLEIIKILLPFLPPVYLQQALNSSLRQTVLNKQDSLMKFFMEQGANNWNEGFRAALRFKRVELMEMFMEKGANCLDECIAQAEKNAEKSLKRPRIEVDPENEEEQEEEVDDSSVYGLTLEQLCEFKQAQSKKKKV